MPVPNVGCCVLVVPNPENNGGADVVAVVPNPPKPPKLELPIVLVGAVDPSPKVEVEAAGVVPNPPELLPKPKFGAGVLKVLAVVVVAVPNPVATGVPKLAPVPNPDAGWAAGVPNREGAAEAVAGVPKSEGVVVAAGVLNPKVPVDPNPAK